MSLDALYGKGFSAAFRKAVDGKTTEVDIDSGVRAYVEWDDGSTMKIDCDPKRVHFQALDSNRKGLYTDLCNILPDLFKKQGVEVFTATPANEESEAILRKRGGWDDDMKWEL